MLTLLDYLGLKNLSIAKNVRVSFVPTLWPDFADAPADQVMDEYGPNLDAAGINAIKYCTYPCCPKCAL